MENLLSTNKASSHNTTTHNRVQWWCLCILKKETIKKEALLYQEASYSHQNPPHKKYLEGKEVCHPKLLNLIIHLISKDPKLPANFKVYTLNSSLDNAPQLTSRYLNQAFFAIWNQFWNYNFDSFSRCSVTTRTIWYFFNELLLLFSPKRSRKWCSVSKQ